MSKVTCMPPTAYNRTISTIRDYPRMLCEVERLRRDIASLGATNYDGMPKGGTSSGLEDKIARLVDLEMEVQRIQEVIDTIPADMRDGVLDNILYHTRYPLCPSEATWRREKSKFVVLMARKLRIY